MESSRPVQRVRDCCAGSLPGPQHVKQQQQQHMQQQQALQQQADMPQQQPAQHSGTQLSSIPAGTHELVDGEEASDSSGSEGSSAGSSEGLEDEEEEEEEEEEGEEGSGQGSIASADDLPLINSPAWTPDHTFKVLLVGDSGVGKTCLVMRFIADKFETQLPSTVGVDFAIKRMVVGDQHIKLTIWDTAGQERFRALTSTFYRGAVGIIFVYDVTRRETLSSLSGSWMQELASYDPHPEVACMVVANKVDQHDKREVTWQEGADFAKQHGCLFVETSAKHNIAVGVAFEELVLRILDTPALLAAVQAEEQKGSSLNLTAAASQAGTKGMAISCSC